MNIGNAINEANKILKKNNIKSPKLDSEILMSKVIQKDRKFVILNLTKEMNKNTLCDFKELINKRSKGKPIAYLLGKKDFWKYEFKVGDNILIPRPDTEIIIDQILRITKFKSKLNMLVSIPISITLLYFLLAPYSMPLFFEI